MTSRGRLRIAVAVAASAAVLACAIVLAHGFFFSRSPRPVTIAVIGDSYTGGTVQGGVLGSPSNWTADLSRNLGEQGFAVSLRPVAAGGSGYVATGRTHRTFAQMVPDAVGPGTDVLIVFGSINDTGLPGVMQAAAQAYGAARTINPRIRLLVVGTPWVDGAPPPIAVANRDAVRAASESAGASFADPLAEAWFWGDDPALIGADRIHPTDSGHARMGRAITVRIYDILGER